MLATRKTRKSAPAPLPVIDLGGWLMVIDESGAKPVWKRLERLPADSEVCVERALRKHGLKWAWVKNDLGERRPVNANPALHV